MENEAVKEIIKTKELTFDYIRHDEEGNEEGDNPGCGQCEPGGEAG